MKAYYNGYRRSGIAKVHIVRTTPVRRHQYVSSWVKQRGEFNQAWCGVSAMDHTASPRCEIDPTKPLEPGLSWCGPCLGRAAEHAELLADIVALLVAKDTS